MTMLQFWPRQPHHLLEVGKRRLRAGELFRAAEEDVERLLGCDDIRLPERPAKAPRKSGGAQDSAPQGTQEKDASEQPESDGGAAGEKDGAAEGTA